MEIPRNLVIGRLDLESIRARWPASSGGTARLGLVPHVSDGDWLFDAEPDQPRRKRTFKLPVNLLDRLKAYATVRGRYQYCLVAEALRRYLDEAIAGMGYLERSAVANLTELYAERAARSQAPAAAEECQERQEEAPQAPAAAEEGQEHQEDTPQAPAAADPAPLQPALLPTA